MAFTTWRLLAYTILFNPFICSYYTLLTLKYSVFIALTSNITDLEKNKQPKSVRLGLELTELSVSHFNNIEITCNPLHTRSNSSASGASDTQLTTQSHSNTQTTTTIITTPTSTQFTRKLLIVHTIAPFVALAYVFVGIAAALACAYSFCLGDVIDPSDTAFVWRPWVAFLSWPWPGHAQISHN
ncbi:hypothetical protein V1512DRAFT_84648 [Lipomyces arxii]|uniref:uncharacterized protein n=1 Tax=Lipomyces arxii TaxID=56418 RepID=UPI0034CDB2ED